MQILVKSNNNKSLDPLFAQCQIRNKRCLKWNERKVKVLLFSTSVENLTADYNWVIDLSVCRSHREFLHLFHFMLSWIGRISYLGDILVSKNTVKFSYQNQYLWNRHTLWEEFCVFNDCLHSSQLSHREGQSNHKISLQQASRCFFQVN